MQRATTAAHDAPKVACIVSNLLEIRSDRRDVCATCPLLSNEYHQSNNSLC